MLNQTGEKGEPKSYSVSKLNSYLKHIFQSDYLLSHICVNGEVSNLKYHTSGHIYFTLKDEKSQLACVMFAGSRQGLSFRLEEGQEILVWGNVDLYERDGKYQMYARKITRSGSGLLYERFLHLKEELEDEGLFSPIYKKKIPAYARKIGIVTAETGAAVRDIINIATRRNPYIELLLYPAKVQGEGAAESVARGIRRLEKEKPDVIIIGRGGGSIEDLWAFNEEIVARAVFECDIPVISAVGHETDVTIADYVADLRAPTPSAAAELAVCNIRDVLYTVSEYQNALTRGMEQKLSAAKLRFSMLYNRLSGYNPESWVQMEKQKLRIQREKLHFLMEGKMKGERHRLALYAQQLQGLSPLEQLCHGFSYVSNQRGENVSSVKAVKKGQSLNITVRDGWIQAIVEDWEKADNKDLKGLGKQNGSKKDEDTGRVLSGTE